MCLFALYCCSLNSNTAANNNQSCWDVHCESHGGLCAVLVVDGGAEPREARKQYRALLNARDAQDNSLFHYMWVNASTQPGLVDALGASFYPTVIAVSAKKKRAAQFVGAYDKENVAAFLKGVLSGRERTTEMQKDVPALINSPDGTPRLCGTP